MTMPSASRLTPAAVTFGFGTAAAMWFVGFVTHLPAVRPAPVVIAVLLLAVQCAGAYFAGRTAGPGRAWKLGVIAGVITGLINLLIIGSVVASDTHESGLRPGWTVIILGALGLSALIGAIGATLGARTAPSARPDADATLSATTTSPWLPRFAFVTLLAALPVLLSGGLVTSTNTGLAVPDWPTSYNANMFLYPLSKMTGGIYYEHAHRLFGSLIGLTTLALCVFIFMGDRRAWVKALGVVAFLFVCGQGVLGGIRVTSASVVSEIASPEQLADNKASLALAAVHGVTAQLFFGLLAAIAVILSPVWHRLAERRTPHDALMRPFAMLLVAGLTLQLILGSVTRHFQHAHATWSHVGFAVIVLVLACLAGFRASGKHADVRIVRMLGKGIVHTVGLQLALGIATLIAVFPFKRGDPEPAYAVILATSHQALGAVLIAGAFALAAFSMRMHWASRDQSAAIPAAGTLPSAA
jgi:heme A synthase